MFVKSQSRGRVDEVADVETKTGAFVLMALFTRRRFEEGQVSRGGVNLGSGGREAGSDGGWGVRGMGCQHLGERVLEVEDGDSEELWEGLRGSAGVINGESGVRRTGGTLPSPSSSRSSTSPTPPPTSPPRLYPIPAPSATPPSCPFVTVFPRVPSHTLLTCCRPPDGAVQVCSPTAVFPSWICFRLLAPSSFRLSHLRGISL